MQFPAIILLPGLLAALSLPACNQQPQQTVAPATAMQAETPADSTRSFLAQASSMPARARPTPLRLEFSDDLFEPVAPLQQLLIPGHTEDTQRSFEPANRSRKLSLSGKVHLDDDEQDYVEAIEGAEVNIEIKFE